MVNMYSCTDLLQLVRLTWTNSEKTDQWNCTVGLLETGKFVTKADDKALRGAAIKKRKLAYFLYKGLEELYLAPPEDFCNAVYIKRYAETFHDVVSKRIYPQAIAACIIRSLHEKFVFCLESHIRFAGKYEHVNIIKICVCVANAPIARQEVAQVWHTVENALRLYCKANVLELQVTTGKFPIESRKFQLETSVHKLLQD